MPLKGEEGCSLAPLGKKQAFGEKSFVQWAVSGKRCAAPSEQQLMQRGRGYSEEQGATGG